MIRPSDIERLDEAIKAHFVLKYELMAVDEDGRGIYLKRWMPSDLDFVRQWEQWRHSEHKKEAEFKKWCDLAAEEDIIVRGLNDKKNTNLILMCLAAVGGAGAMWFFGGSNKEEEPKKEEPPAKPSDIISVMLEK